MWNIIIIRYYYDTNCVLAQSEYYIKLCLFLTLKETSIATKRPLLERLESKPSKKRRVINRDDLSDS